LLFSSINGNSHHQMATFKSILFGEGITLKCANQREEDYLGSLNWLKEKTIYLDQRFPYFSERDPNLSLVNISRPKPQTAYLNMKNALIAWMIFGRKFLSSFSLSAIYSFLKYLRYTQTQQAVVTSNIYSPGLNRLCATHFLTLCDPCLDRDTYFGNHCLRRPFGHDNWHYSNGIKFGKKTAPFKTRYERWSTGLVYIFHSPANPSRWRKKTEFQGSIYL